VTTVTIGGDDSKQKYLHIISMGREGSSFLCAFMRKGGIPCVHEPFWGSIEGSGILRDQIEDKRLKCIFGKEHECPSGVQLHSKKDELIQTLQDNTDKPIISFKTTRIVDLSKFSTLSEDQIARSKFIVLFRDPRAVWASLAPFTGWAVRNIHYVCKASELKQRTFKDMVAAVGSERVMPIVFEHWARDPHFAEKLAAFIGLESVPEAWKTYEPHASSVTKWASQGEYARDYKQIVANPACKSYMDAMGYPTDYVNNADDYLTSGASLLSAE